MTGLHKWATYAWACCLKTNYQDYYSICLLTYKFAAFIIWNCLYKKSYLQIHIVQLFNAKKTMWHYVWAHAIFHLVRWFPPSNRVKITVVTVAITLCLTIPQIYVLFLEKTERWCPEPLFEFLILSIIFTFFVIGFTFLFVTMIPVPRQLKIAFHVFGLITSATGMAQCILVSKSEDCQYSTPELYDISLALAVLSGVSICYVASLLPFWIINVLRRDCVLNRPARDGFCYEPVKCCSCLWHI